MGVIGEMFPGKKLQDEGNGDSDGQGHKPTLNLDLDAGVIRLSGGNTPQKDDDA